MTDAGPLSYDPAHHDVWLWMGRPEVGFDHLLFAIVEAEGQLAYRPMLATDQAGADSWAPLAEQAAKDLGVEAVLGRYELRSLMTVDHEQEVTPDDPR